jgi:hypothetical protein
MKKGFAKYRRRGRTEEEGKGRPWQIEQALRALRYDCQREKYMYRMYLQGSPCSSATVPSRNQILTHDSDNSPDGLILAPVPPISEHNVNVDALVDISRGEKAAFGVCNLKQMLARLSICQGLSFQNATPSSEFQIHLASMFW